MIHSEKFCCFMSLPSFLLQLSDFMSFHSICRDSYNSLTSAKLPPKNEDGQLKSICVVKKADKINLMLEK